MKMNGGWGGKLKSERERERERKKKGVEDDPAWRENKNTTAKNSIGLKSVWRETNLKRLTVNIDFYTRYRRQIFIVREFNKLCTRFGVLTYAMTRCSFFFPFLSLSLSRLVFIFFPTRLSSFSLRPSVIRTKRCVIAEKKISISVYNINNGANLIYRRSIR